MKKKQDKILFLHIPKNGGTTFHSIIERFYEKENIFTIKVVDSYFMNTGQFIKLTDSQRKDILLLKGHFNFGFHKYLFGKYKYITFLRIPSQRVLSYYNYVCSKENHRLHKQVIENRMTFMDFVRNINQHDLNNAQVRLISGIDDEPKFMLEKALENIEKHFSFVGLTEYYDQSLVMLKKMYNWGMPYYSTLNKTSRGNNIKDFVPEIIEEVNYLNEADNLLYDSVCRNFKSLCDKFPNFNTELIKHKLYNKLYNSKAKKELWKLMNKNLG